MSVSHFALDLTKGYGEQHVFGGVNMDTLCVRQYMITRTKIAPDFGLPVGHVPFQAFGCDAAGALQGDDADMFLEDGILAGLFDVNLVASGLEQEGQAGLGQQVDSTVSIFGA